MQDSAETDSTGPVLAAFDDVEMTYEARSSVAANQMRSGINV
jgi:hypothetical protein